RRGALGSNALVALFLHLLDVRLELRDLLARAFGFRLDAVDAGVPRYLDDADHDEDEEAVGRGAVPECAPLERELPLGDALEVGGERVREVVGLDDKPAGFDDLALDFP